jgi:large subunit ribosomal protein L16
MTVPDKPSAPPKFLVCVDQHEESVAALKFACLKAITRGRLTARQLEAARRAMSRHIKRGGRIWIRVFPDKPISTKPAEVRMGNGKGNPEYFVAEIQPGKVLFEMDGVTEALAKEAFALAAAKLPFRTAVVQRMLG